jgi:PiT family inorganic phosphate transporter
LSPADGASTPLVYIVIALAWGFNFILGFHDTANSIATVVSTRVLSPRSAVVMSAVLNLAGALVSVQVAQTIGKGIVAPESVTITVTLATLIAAITWNLITWYWGLPSSSSHAIVGAIVGATLVASGVEALNLAKLGKVFLGLVLSPALGFLFGTMAMRGLVAAFQRTSAYVTGWWFRKLQLFSAAFMSFSHGENDAQMSMGLIAAAMVMVSGSRAPGAELAIPLWVKASCALMIGVGTSVGGWRIIKTMGVRMLRLRPIDGFAAETSAALLIHAASQFGLPVSTTHTITSSLMGVGAARRLSAVRWRVVKSIVLAWLFTLPASAALAAVIRLILGR